MACVPVFGFVGSWSVGDFNKRFFGERTSTRSGTITMCQSQVLVSFLNASFQNITQQVIPSRPNGAPEIGGPQGWLPLAFFKHNPHCPHFSVSVLSSDTTQVSRLRIWPR